MVAERDTASSHGTPVYITVWDLSPPSTWSSAAHGLFGLGIFHTNIWFPDLSVEWAFGGHGYANVSGIFSLPRDATTIDCIHEYMQQSGSSSHDLPPKPSTLDGLSLLGPDRIPQPGSTPIPNARYIGAYFIGYAAEDSVKKASSDKSIDARWACTQSGKRAFREPDSFVDPYYVTASKTIRSLPASSFSSQSSVLSSDSPDLTARSTYRRHPRHRGQRLAAVTYVTKFLQSLRSDPEWMGPNYDLLSRNCNHFTDMVCMRLVGAHIPTWINRSAMLGRNVVRVIPRSILDLETSIALEDDPYHHTDDEDSFDKSSTDHPSSVQQRLHDEVHSAESRT